MLFGSGADADHARRLLERVGFSHRLTYRPPVVHRQQRAAVARASPAQLVLADEPTNLDQRHSIKRCSSSAKLPRNRAVLLLVSHDPSSRAI
jgi:predicted ABC-type transport system involved in lysophospholipase L1 biosynthesis ATPase subunit